MLGSWFRSSAGGGAGAGGTAEEESLTADLLLAPKRRCTNLACLVVFLLFMAGMVACMGYALEHGDPRRLTHGFNYHGDLCGVDAGVAANRYLYYCADQYVPGTNTPMNIDFEAPVCVHSCPLGEAEVVHCPAAARVVTTSSGTYPDVTTMTTIVKEVKPQNTYKTRPMMNLFCVPDMPGNMTLAKVMMESGPMAGHMTKVLTAVGSLRRTGLVIAGSAVLAVFLGYAYLFSLRLIARPLVWGLLVTCFLVFAGAAGYFICMAMGIASATVGGNTHSVKNLFAEVSEEHAYWMNYTVGGVCAVVALVLLLVMVCGRKKINTAIGCVRAACACVFGMPSLLFQPLIEVAVKMALFSVMLLGFMYLMSCGEVKRHTATIGGKTVAGVHRSFTYTDEEKYMLVYYVFGYLWVMELVSAFGQFCLAYSVVHWYFTPRDQKSPMLPMVRACATAFRYHLGSLALGAFLIAVIRLVKLIVAYLAKQQQVAGNKALACVLKAVTCCISCFERFMKFVNKNAYIDIAMKGSTFWEAAKSSFKFLFENASTISLLNGACFIFEVMGVLAISGGCGGVTYLAVTRSEHFTSNVSNHYVANPEFVAGVATMLAVAISYSFMTVFDMAADTLLYAFAYNKSKNPSSVARYAPAELADLVDEKRG